MVTAYVDSSIGDASYLNPLLASDSASGDIVGLVFNGLVKYDKNIQLVGGSGGLLDGIPGRVNHHLPICGKM